MQSYGWLVLGIASEEGDGCEEGNYRRLLVLLLSPGEMIRDEWTASRWTGHTFVLRLLRSTFTTFLFVLYVLQPL